MRKKGILFGAILLVVFLPELLNHLFLQQLELKAGVKVRKKPLWMMQPGVLALNPASLQWGDQLEIRSGKLKINYPLTAFLRSRFPLQLEGSDLDVGLSSGLSAAVGQSQILFRRVRAEILVNGDKGLDLDSFDADSDTLQFHLKGKPS